MDSAAELGVVRDYLAFLERDSEPSKADLPALAELLDRLAVAYHQLPNGKPGDADAPRGGDEKWRKLASARFPAFGYYNSLSAISTELTTAEVLVGDAISDVAEIAYDLSQVLWLWENISIDDALWEYKDSYRIHWGRHLHELRSYLHEVMFQN